MPMYKAFIVLSLKTDATVQDDTPEMAEARIKRTVLEAIPEGFRVGYIGCDLTQLETPQTPTETAPPACQDGTTVLTGQE